jgi:hypothetical protein
MPAKYLYLGWVGLLLPGARIIHYWRAALPNPVLTIKLADWVTDFVGTLARMLAHVGLPPDPARERFYEAGTRVRTVSARSAATRERTWPGPLADLLTPQYRCHLYRDLEAGCRPSGPLSA